MGYVAQAIKQRVIDAAVQFSGGHKVPTDSKELDELLKISVDMPEIKRKIEFERIPVYDNVYLISGGMDSYIQWNSRPKEDTSSLALFVNYGQPYAEAEEDAVRQYFPQAHKHHYLLPQDPEQTKHIVPFRNLYLLTVANTFLAQGGSIHLGVVQGESGTTGDKSREFLRKFEKYIYSIESKHISIVTMVDKTKNDWLDTYLKETGDIEVFGTVTCFGKTDHCGECKACVRKCIALFYSGYEELALDMYPDITETAMFTGMYETMASCMATDDFSHYSETRLRQDLATMDSIQMRIKKG